MRVSRFITIKKPRGWLARHDERQDCCIEKGARVYWFQLGDHKLSITYYLLFFWLCFWSALGNLLFAQTSRSLILLINFILLSFCSGYHLSFDRFFLFIRLTLIFAKMPAQRLLLRSLSLRLLLPGDNRIGVLDHHLLRNLNLHFVVLLPLVLVMIFLCMRPHLLGCPGRHAHCYLFVVLPIDLIH